jgi:hypothetical protein
MRRGVAGQASAVRASIMHAWEALAGGKCLPSAACMGYVLGSHSTSPKAALNPLNLKSYNKLWVSLQGDSGGEMPQRGRGIVSRKEMTASLHSRSLASAANRSAVVSGCAWRHRRACYTTSSQDAGRGAADKSREKGKTGTHGNTGGGEVPLAACSGADKVGAPRCPVQSWDRGQPGSSPGACRLHLLTHLLTEPQYFQASYRRAGLPLDR